MRYHSLDKATLYAKCHFTDCVMFCESISHTKQRCCLAGLGEANCYTVESTTWLFRGCDSLKNWILPTASELIDHSQSEFRLTRHGFLVVWLNKLNDFGYFFPSLLSISVCNGKIRTMLVTLQCCCEDWTWYVENVRHIVGSPLWLLSEVRSGGYWPLQASAFHLIIASTTSSRGLNKWKAATSFVHNKCSLRDGYPHMKAVFSLIYIPILICTYIYTYIYTYTYTWRENANTKSCSSDELF